MTTSQRSPLIRRCIVTAQQMQAIESRLFEAGMPVAALMDKAGWLVAQRIQQVYPLARFPRVGVLTGPGHNGGDALVVARELFTAGYEVLRHTPFRRHKELTDSHWRYADHLGIPTAENGDELQACDVIVDGLFGFGLTRPLEGAIAHRVNQVNDWNIPVVSIDLPSGLDTDTGKILGTAIRASHTFCLGLWKRSLFQDPILDYVGTAELIDLGIPQTDIEAVLGESPSCQCITPASALAALPLPRLKATHKYREGHGLVVCGSRNYRGAPLLTALAARASGVGMLTVAVPDSLVPILVGQVPDALVVGCPESESGAIAQFPDSFQLDAYDAIACGPGMTLGAERVVRHLLECDRPLVLDADGLNILSQWNPVEVLKQRSALTVLTPHPGEFKRLFPDIAHAEQLGGDRLTMAEQAAQQSQATIILKGARTVIATPTGTIWVNPDSTPALARGGSGDVLTGMLGGLLAQVIARGLEVDGVMPSAVWWHAQGAIAAAADHTELGVDASTLITYLNPILKEFQDLRISCEKPRV